MRNRHKPLEATKDKDKFIPETVVVKEVTPTTVLISAPNRTKFDNSFSAKVFFWKKLFKKLVKM